MLKSPNFLFAVVAVVILVIFVFVGKRTADLHLYDTYFVVSLKRIFGAASSLLFILWFIGAFADHVMYSRMLVRLHVYSTLIAVILICGVGIYANIYQSQPGSSQVDKFSAASDWTVVNRNISIIVQLSAALLATAILIMLVNLIIGVIR